MKILEIIRQTVGLFGEICNFYGALVLAKDVVGREDEYKQQLNLEELSQWLRDQDLPVRLPSHFAHSDLKQPGAVALVLIHRAITVGKRGVLWLIWGFACLLLDHLLSLLQVLAQAH